MKTNELPTSTCQDPERLSVRESRIWLTHCSITLLTVWNSSCTCRDSYCMASPASSDKKRCRTHSSGHSHAAAEKLHKRLWIIHGGHHWASWSIMVSWRVHTWKHGWLQQFLEPMPVLGLLLINELYHNGETMTLPGLFTIFTNPVSMSLCPLWPQIPVTGVKWFFCCCSSSSSRFGMFWDVLFLNE